MSLPAPSPSSSVFRRPVTRAVLFWARHLVLLQVLLLALVWLLYGSLDLYGHGEYYYARAIDFWLERRPHLFDGAPGIENVLLPAAGAAVAWLGAVAGFAVDQTWFALLAIAPYPLFALGLTRIVRTGFGSSPAKRRNDPVLACAAALAIYTSGMIPYMASWGGYVDGVSYLLMLPVLIWPGSLAVYAATFVLQCLNHYLGAVALLLLAFVWHTIGPVARSSGMALAPEHLDRAIRVSSPLAFAAKVLVSALVLAAFVAFWNAAYPEAARVRQQLALDKWSNPAAVLTEVLGPFPWTLLSTLKLTIVPIAALMLAPLPGRRNRMLALATPFVAAFLMTLVFVDVTRVATMLVLPALLVTLRVAGDPATDTATRRRLRRLLLATAALNLLVPNYYVNNGALQVPPSVLLRQAIDWIAGT